MSSWQSRAPFTINPPNFSNLRERRALPLALACRCALDTGAEDNSAEDNSPGCKLYRRRTRVIDLQELSRRALLLKVSMLDPLSSQSDMHAGMHYHLPDIVEKPIVAFAAQHIRVNSFYDLRLEFGIKRTLKVFVYRDHAMGMEKMR